MERSGLRRPNSKGWRALQADDQQKRRAGGGAWERAPLGGGAGGTQALTGWTGSRGLFRRQVLSTLSPTAGPPEPHRRAPASHTQALAHPEWPGRATLQLVVGVQEAPADAPRAQQSQLDP